MQTNDFSKDYPHPDGHTEQITDTPGFKTFTTNKYGGVICHGCHSAVSQQIKELWHNMK